MKKIAIVTGASSGMGREAALQIAGRFGAIQELWVIARREERLKELEGQIPTALRRFSLDLKKEEDLFTLKKALEEEKPEVKLLVNGAGFGKIGKTDSIDWRDEADMVQLNCQALCAVTHLVLPHMSPNSRILQFASAAAFLPQPGFAVYAATKSFVLSYSRALNVELKPRGILVTAVCPGPVETEFFQVAETTGKMASYKKWAMASPEKVVKMALRDAAMGKPVSVYGGMMKAFRLLCKVLPHGWLLKAMR